jgi:predicted short-subunit dehydrogenase-like oxidoreductase (DUF2520 family)
MLPAMRRPSIAIVGTGRLGTALAMRLSQAGYSVPEITVREIIVRQNSPTLASARKLARRIGARIIKIGTAAPAADLVWFCVPDSELAKTAAVFASQNWRGGIAFHSSGVLSSDALAALRKKGVKVASVHPLMTFVTGSLPELGGVTFAVEGDPAATRLAYKIVRDLGGDAMPLQKKDKPAYHAFATMICPLLVSLLASSEAVAGLAGISRGQARRRMMPIIRQTLENYLRLGPARAFSGPIVRGDVETVRLHLRALAKTPAAKDAYLALARAALKYLPSQKKKELQKLLRGP